MATVKLPDNGQQFPVDDAIAANDELLKSVLRSVCPEIGEPTIRRDKENGEMVVTVVKQAGRKGINRVGGVTGVLLDDQDEDDQGEDGDDGDDDDDNPPSTPGAHSLPLHLVRTDGGTQARAGISEETVAEYEQGVRGGDDFPPVTVFHDGTDYWLADGFHRLEAHRRAGESRIEARVRRGTHRDAALFAAGANATHGLRRTNADKNRVVEMLLLDEEWGQWSDRKVAELCGVSHVFVGDVRKRLSGNGYQMPATRTVQRGESTYSFTPTPVSTSLPAVPPTPTTPTTPTDGSPAPTEVAQTNRAEAAEAEEDGESGAETELQCRVCGCTEAEGCEDGCSWVENDLCSRCADTLAAHPERVDALMAAEAQTLQTPHMPGAAPSNVPQLEGKGEDYGDEEVDEDGDTISASAASPDSANSANSPHSVTTTPPTRSTSQNVATVTATPPQTIVQPARKAASFEEATVALSIKLLPSDGDPKGRLVLVVGSSDGIIPVVLPTAREADLEPLPEGLAPNLAIVLSRIEEQYS